MRIVIKVGSNVLTRPDGHLNITRVSAIVDQIAWLKQQGHELILVSSGAVACGRRELQVNHDLDTVEQRQLFSALGQVKLIGLYYDLFREHGMHMGQILTMKENFEPREQYDNQQACMRVMLENDVIPIVNENDTVSVTELMFTDNDELSGLIARMMDADMLVLLSNIDGIYDGNPTDPQSRIIPEVAPGRDLSEYIQTTKSSAGRGGMVSKYTTATRVQEAGIQVIIANGKTPDILINLIEHPMETMHTEFVPNPEGVSGVKKWIAHSESFAKGQAIINPQAVEALRGEKAVSLLLVGVTHIDGDFDEGDIINIVSPEGKVIGIGKSNYSADEARTAIGQHDVKPLIHYDYLYIE